jgi:hypothetical protein
VGWGGCTGGGGGRMFGGCVGEGDLDEQGGQGSEAKELGRFHNGTVQPNKACLCLS